MFNWRSAARFLVATQRMNGRFAPEVTLWKFCLGEPDCSVVIDNGYPNFRVVNLTADYFLSPRHLTPTLAGSRTEIRFLQGDPQLCRRAFGAGLLRIFKAD
jgi:hypothetical protein